MTAEGADRWVVGLLIAGSHSQSGPSRRMEDIVLCPTIATAYMCSVAQTELSSVPRVRSQFDVLFRFEFDCVGSTREACLARSRIKNYCLCMGA